MSDAVFKGRTSEFMSFPGSTCLNDNTILGMWYWDVKQDRIYTDARLAALFSVDPREAIRGASVGAYVSGIHSGDRERVAREVAHCIGAGIDFSSQYRIATAAGERRIAAFARCHRMEDGSATHYVGITLDITDTVGAETPTANVADHVMQAYRVAKDAGDEELKGELKNLLVRIGRRLSREASPMDVA